MRTVALCVFLLIAGCNAEPGEDDAQMISKGDALKALQEVCDIGSDSSMPYVVGCELARACGVKVGGSGAEEESHDDDDHGSNNGGFVSLESTTTANADADSTQCSLPVLLATVCSDDLASDSPACDEALLDTEEVALELVALNLTTLQTWDFVQLICSHHAGHLGRIYEGTLSYPDPQIVGRRRLLHDGEKHSSSTVEKEFATKIKPLVPHTADSHEACASCVKTRDSADMMGTDCAQGPLAPLAYLCASTLEADGPDNLVFVQNCMAWAEFCDAHAEAFPGYCQGL